MTLYSVPSFREKYPSITKDDLISLNDLNSLSERMEKLSKFLEIPVEEYNERRAACEQVRDLLKKYYPDCLLLMFGSSVNGFGVKHADVDVLFLPFPEYCNLDYVETGKPSIPNPESVLTGKTSKNVLSKLDESSHIKFIRNILRREKKDVERFTFIPTRIPTLKAYFKNCKFPCDIFASNRLVVFNSELLQFLKKLDPRVKPLVMTLRYWAWSLGFIKRSFFSSYAFLILIIFFLQDINPPVLPSVKHLIEISGFSRKTAGWQTAFTTDEKLVEKSQNTETISELLIHFFKYYWEFDFVENIVCPYSGKTLSIKDVRDSKDERMANFETTSINIQDPFILSCNIFKVKDSMKICPKVLLKLALFTAYQMIQEKSDKYKFSMLFDPSEYQKIFDTEYEKYMTGNPKVCFISIDYSCVANLSKTTKNSQVWYEKASQAVFDVLQYGLLMECEVIDKMATGHGKDDTDQKHVALERNLSDKPNSGSTPYELELLSTIQCVMYSRTWMGRKSVTNIPMGENELEEFHGTTVQAEHNISKELVKKNASITSTVPLLCFKCDLYKHTCPQIADIIVMLKPLSLSRECHQVFSFLAAYIPRTVKKILSSE